jgi:protein-disulfide isomerase
MTQYKISGVPTFVVGGKYQTSEADAGGAQPLFQTLDKLIDGERKALAPAKPTRK